MNDKADNEDIPADVESVHPFVTMLFAGLERGGEERYAFPLDLANQVYSGLIEFEGEAELTMIIEQMLGLAIMMQQEFESPTVAAQIFAILEDDKVQNITRDIKALADPNLDELGNRFGSFAGNEIAKTAPKVGDEKPEGALSLDELNFPKRM